MRCISVKKNVLEWFFHSLPSLSDPSVIFPRSPWIPWRPATAKIPPLTYKDIFLYTHTHTLSHCFLANCVVVRVSLLSASLSSSAGSYWSRVRCVQTSCCSMIKATEKRQESLFPQAPGARDIKRGERERGGREGKGGRKETCCSDICWFEATLTLMRINLTFLAF